MKNYSLTLLIGLSIFSFKSFGQSTLPIQNTVENLRLLLETPDKIKLEKIAHEKLTYGHSGGKVENKAEFIEAFISGKTDFVNLKFTDIAIDQVGNTAIVRHILEADSKDLGKEPGHVKLKVILVFVKSNKAWKLLARQAVKI
jgi:hypothetical protein